MKKSKTSPIVTSMNNNNNNNNYKHDENSSSFSSFSSLTEMNINDGINRIIISFQSIDDIKSLCLTSKNFLDLNIYKKDAYQYIQKQNMSLTSGSTIITRRARRRIVLLSLVDVLKQIINGTMIVPVHLNAIIFSRMVQEIIHVIPKTCNLLFLIVGPDDNNEEKDEEERMLASLLSSPSLLHCPLPTTLRGQDQFKALAEVVFMQMTYANRIKLMIEFLNKKMQSRHRVIIEYLIKTLSKEKLESLAEIASHEINNNFVIRLMIKYLVGRISKAKLESLAVTAIIKIHDDENIRKVIKIVKDEISFDQFESLAKIAMNKITDGFSFLFLIRHLVGKLSQDKKRLLADFEVGLNKLPPYDDDNDDDDDDDINIQSMVTCYKCIRISQIKLESLSEIAINKMSDDYYIKAMIKFLKDKISLIKLESLAEIAINKMSDHFSIQTMIDSLADKVSQIKLESLAERALNKMTDDYWDDLKWKSNLQIGDKVDAQDRGNNWFDSEVKEIRDAQLLPEANNYNSSSNNDIKKYLSISKMEVKIRYKGWSPKFDNWIPVTSNRIQKLWSKVENWRDFNINDPLELKSPDNTGKIFWCKARVLQIRNENDGKIMIYVTTEDCKVKTKRWVDTQGEEIAKFGTHNVTL